MTVAYHGNNRTALIDDETRLWCARMLEGEGYKNGKGAAVLWATLYRFLGWKNPDKFKSYLDMIKRFSSPINEEWLPGGSLYEKYKDSPNKAHQLATSPQAVKRRSRIISTPWENLPKEARSIVDQFSIGGLLPPPKFGNKKYSNFASYPAVKEKYPNGIDIGGDWFILDPYVDTDYQISISDESSDIPDEDIPKDTPEKKNSQMNRD